MATVVQPKESIQWGNIARSFNSLVWFDIVISFIFRFMAKVSEPLLAAGVIISAIDFLQRGQLLAHNPELSLWWSVAQGVAMEVSIGPVLMNALDAREDGDTVKMKFYAALSAVLAIVGSAMLLMQFGLSVAGLTESQIVPWLLWTLFAIRTVASIGYIALSCTKHKRFSGVSPKMVVQQVHRQFDEAVANLAVSQQHALQSLTQQMTAQIAVIETNTAQQIQSLSQEVSRSYNGLSVRFTEVQSATQEQMEGARLSMLQEFDARLHTINQELASEVQTVKSVLTTLQTSTPSVVPHKPKASTLQTSLTVVQSEADIEKRIRTLLEEDSTLSVRVLARRANISPATADKYKKRILSA